MTDEMDFFSNDCNNWNYNQFINTPNADPYNKNRTNDDDAFYLFVQNQKLEINISSNNSCNLI